MTPNEKDKFARRMAKYITSAAAHGLTIEKVIQKQSCPAAEVAKYLNEPSATAEPDRSEEKAIQSLATKVDITDVIFGKAREVERYMHTAINARRIG